MQPTRTPPSIRGFRLKDLWRLRYRFYAILVILILPIILYSSDANVKDNVSVDAGFRIVDSNILASRITREKSKNQYLQKSVEDSNQNTITSKNDSKIQEKIFQPIPGSLNVSKGELKAFDSNNKDISTNYLGSTFFKEFIKGSNNDNKARISLEDVIKQPEVGIKYSWLSFPKYKIQTPIQYATFDDLFDQKTDQKSKETDKTKPQEYNFGNLKDTSALDSSVQKKLEQGIVHLGYTVAPGEIGNSYIVGHSSNFASVKSDYNTIFKPIENATKNGDEFFIFDQKGRELKFCVFDNLKIPEEDIKTAYQEFSGQRIVTLQTSILGWRNGKIEATHRWLSRGKLCNEPIQSQPIPK